MSTELNVVNNKQEFRFEVSTGNDYAIVTYRWLKGSMVLMHTFVPDEARGKGIASALVKYVLDYVREQGLKIIVYCPFIAKYMKEHPEYNDLLDTTHKNQGA